MAKCSGAERTVVLVHQREVLHYRIAVYNRLNEFLREHGWHLIVIAQSLQSDAPHEATFQFRAVDAQAWEICGVIYQEKPDAVISFVNAKETYLFPMLLFLKALRVPAIYWGHGVDLEDRQSKIKRVVYALEHRLCAAVLLYSDEQRRFLSRAAVEKSFVAQNTIDTSVLSSSGRSRYAVLREHGISSAINIICVGRMQRRKRIHHLVEAFMEIPDENCGLILVGPDVDGCLANVSHPRIYQLGPLYGSQLFELLESSDVACLPGHVGLSIVDAMFFGLPFVTEDVDHAPEIMYLKDGTNGFKVPADDVPALSAALGRLIKDGDLRRKMSGAARETIRSEASIDNMCAGFLASLEFACAS